MTAQLDYLYFVCGLAFLSLGVLCRMERKKDPGQRVLWFWISVFAMFHGCGMWLDLYAGAVADTPWFSAGRAVVDFVVLACLAAGAWRCWPALYPSGVRKWKWAGVLLVYLAAWGGSELVSGHSRGLASLFGLVRCGAGILLAAAAWGRLSESRRPGLRAIFFHANAVALAACIAAGWAVVETVGMRSVKRTLDSHAGSAQLLAAVLAQKVAAGEAARLDLASGSANALPCASAIFLVSVDEGGGPLQVSELWLRDGGGPDVSASVAARDIVRRATDSGVAQASDGSASAQGDPWWVAAPVTGTRSAVLIELDGQRLEGVRNGSRFSAIAAVAAASCGFLAYLYYKRISLHLLEKQVLVAGLNRKLSLAIEQSPSMVVMTDLDGAIEYVNPRFEEVSGYSIREVMGKNSRILKSGQTPRQTYRELWETITAGHIWKGELVNQRKNGELYWEDNVIVPLKDDAGRVTHYIALKEDVTEHKRTGRLLEEQRAKFEKFFENSPAGIAIYESKPGDLSLGRVESWVCSHANTAFAFHTGLEKERVVGRSITEMPYGADDGPFPKIFGRLVLGAETAHYQHNCPDLGRCLDVQIFVIGKHAFAVVVSDITRLKVAESALKASERFARDIIGGIDHGIVVCDSELRYSVWNGWMETVTGMREEDVVGKALDEVCPLENPSQFIGLMRSVLRGVHAPSCEMALMLPGRKNLWLLVTFAPVGGPDGAPSGAVASFANITELKQSQKEVAEVTRRFNHAVKAAALGVWERNVDENTVVWDENMFRIYGLARYQFCGRHEDWLALVHPDDRPSVAAKIEKALASGTRYMNEFRVVRPFGDTRHVESHGLVIRDESGRATKFVGISRDVTDTRRMEQWLVEAKRAAESADRAKSEFLAVMSHEIRTPMNSVIGFSELLLEMGGLGPKQMDAVKTVHSCSEDLLCLINDILDYSKLEAGKFDFEQIECSPAQIAAACCAQHEMRAGRKKISIACECAPDLPAMVVSDPARLKQLMHNLVSNAVKFTSVGGVRVAVGIGPVDVGGTATLHIAVHDTGIGISQEQMGRLFRPFCQADASTTRQYGGTGLGLVICQKICERMGGRITVDSTPGVGSVFEIHVPVQVSPATRDTMQPRASAAAEAWPGLRVLIAEDNTNNQKLLATYFSGRGSHITLADNGWAAVEIFRERPVDLLFMDICMPVMDGLAATERIRQIEAGRPGAFRCPIIGVSAEALPGVRGRCLEAGMDDYISKPIHLSKLSERIKEWVPDIVLFAEA